MSVFGVSRDEVEAMIRQAVDHEARRKIERLERQVDCLQGYHKYELLEKYYPYFWAYGDRLAVNACKYCGSEMPKEMLEPRKGKP
jgi:hypothetical protein